MTTVYYLAVTGWIMFAVAIGVAIWINEDWYKTCVKMNSAWADLCKHITERSNDEVTE
jgi:hypothetical protein